MESGPLVFVGRSAKIFLKVDRFLFVTRHYLIRNHRKIGIPIVQERGFPVDQPDLIPSKRILSGLNRSL